LKNRVILRGTNDNFFLKLTSSLVTNIGNGIVRTVFCSDCEILIPAKPKLELVLQEMRLEIISIKEFSIVSVNIIILKKGHFETHSALMGRVK